VLHAAASHGITIVCSSGVDSAISASYPATSPWVLAVGGTSLKASAGKIVSEVVYGDQSGGVSEVLPMPPWQSDVPVPSRKDGKKGRGVPDVAANAEPNHGYFNVLHGSATAVGGTSGATAFWAGVVAVINQGVGHNIGRA